MTIQVMVNDQVSMVVKDIFSGNRVFHIDLVARVVLALLLHGSEEGRLPDLLCYHAEAE